MMRLGVIERVHERGERLIVDARVEGDIERDLALIYPLHLRMQVGEGTRVLVFELDGNDVQRLAMPFEFAGVADALTVHPPTGAAGGKVYVGTVGGAFAALATLADLEQHRGWAIGHTHTSPAGGGATTQPTTQPPAPAGTRILEAE